jgi:hypothetical protein
MHLYQYLARERERKERKKEDLCAGHVRGEEEGGKEGREERTFLRDVLPPSSDYRSLLRA